MDTLICFSKKHHFLARYIFSLVMFSIFIIPCVLMGVPLFAQENLKLANNAIVTPFNTVKLEGNISRHLSFEEQSKNFDNYVKHKYPGCMINNVDIGVKHIKLTKYYNKRPVKINIVEINHSLNPNLEVAPRLASDKLSKKSTITTIAKKNNSIVAINGTYFKPQTGVPLGTLMIDGKLMTGPIYDRVAMGIFDTHYDMARVQLNGVLKNRKEAIKIDNINQPRMLSTYIIAYSASWGSKSPISPKYGKQIVIENNRIVEISTSSQTIPTEGYVIVGPSSKLSNFKVGDSVRVDFETVPEWKNVKHIISGGPYLVKRGDVYVDVKEEKLLSIGGRNPRTAIGYTADNNLIIVTVDGREESSVGITLTELSRLMKSIGCYEAMNLDGGGSTVLYVNGRVVNKPKVQGGIALSNALTLNRIN